MSDGFISFTSSFCDKRKSPTELITRFHLAIYSYHGSGLLLNTNILSRNMDALRPVGQSCREAPGVIEHLKG